MSPAGFATSTGRELRIAGLIFAKLEARDFAYRPTPSSRSIEELLRYLSWCGLDGVLRVLQAEAYQESALCRSAATFALAEIPQRLDHQQAEIAAAIAAVPAERWATGRSRQRWGAPCSLMEALVEIPLKWLTAYRMNLFLWAKECGHHELDRTICWAPPS